jgi:hypothetical protein
MMLFTDPSKSTVAGTASSSNSRCHHGSLAATSLASSLTRLLASACRAWSRSPPPTGDNEDTFSDVDLVHYVDAGLVAKPVEWSVGPSALLCDIKVFLRGFRRRGHVPDTYPNGIVGRLAISLGLARLIIAAKWIAHSIVPLQSLVPSGAIEGPRRKWILLMANNARRRGGLAEKLIGLHRQRVPVRQPHVCRNA